MRVGIVSVSRTRYGGHPGWRPHELTYHAVKEVLSRAGLPIRDGYQEIVTCSSDHWDGKTLSNIEHGEVSGAHLGPGEEKVAMDGADAVLYGCIKVLSGHADVVLVTAACKERDVLDPSVIENFGFDVAFQQPLGLDFTQAAALQAVSFMNRSGLTREHFAGVVVRARRNARGHPNMACTEEVSVEEVTSAEVLSFPIGALDRRPPADGACALVLASEERTLELTQRPVWITGIGSCYESHQLGYRDLSEPLALKRAAKDALKLAQVEDLCRDVDVFELSDHFSPQLPLWVEALGLCPMGGSARFLDSDESSRTGRMPVNPSGGLLAGVPRYVAGADRVIEAYLQLLGEAGAQQVEGDPRVALAHGTYGPAGQHHCVIILERGF